MRLRLCLLLLLALVWLLPLFGAGAMGWLALRAYPRLSFQHSVAGMFMLRTGVWAQMLIQVQIKGTAEWQTVRTAELSPMGCFGYRQRLDRILQETQGRPVPGMAVPRLAAWVAARYEALYPGQKVLGVRFGQTVWAANTPALALPAGHWVPDPPSGRPAVSFHPFAAYVMDQEAGMPRLMAGRPTLPTAPPATAPAKAPVGIGKRFQRLTPQGVPATAPPAKTPAGAAMPATPATSQPRTP